MPEPKGWRVSRLVGRNAGSGDAYNNAAAAAAGDILIQVHDDVVPPLSWDVQLDSMLGPMAEEAWVVGVGDDGYGSENKICTVLVCTKKWVQRCGYMYWPEYRAMYADDDVTQKARAENRLLEWWDKITFKHDWACWGKDETWRKENHKENWQVGREILARRREEGFPNL